MANFAHAEPGGSALVESIELIPPCLLNSQLPVVLENVLVRALALDPAERYASVFEFIEELEAIDLKRDVDALTIAHAIRNSNVNALHLPGH